MGPREAVINREGNPFPVTSSHVYVTIHDYQLLCLCCSFPLCDPIFRRIRTPVSSVNSFWSQKKLNRLDCICLTEIIGWKQENTRWFDWYQSKAEEKLFARLEIYTAWEQRLMESARRVMAWMIWTMLISGWRNPRIKVSSPNWCENHLIVERDSSYCQNTVSFNGLALQFIYHVC